VIEPVAGRNPASGAAWPAGADLATIGGRTRTPARPGPGPIAEDIASHLEVALRRRVGGRRTGDHRGLGSGDGLDLDRIRPYEPGDDVRRIDWNATARSLVPQVREDVPDRQLTAWILVDASASMQFGTAARRKADVAEGVALVIGRVIVRRRDRLGSQTFGSVDRPIIRPPRGGRRAMAGLTGAMAIEPPEEGAGQTSLRTALRSLAATRLRGGLVVVISDFRGPLDWRSELAAVAGRQTVLAVEVFDPREESLVDVGEVTLTDPETGRSLRVDTGDRRLRSAFDQAAAADRAALAGELRRLGVRHVRLSTEGDWLAALARGLEPRTPSR
jgi:uncharacterized protein (DUF58 family)